MDRDQLALQWPQFALTIEFEGVRLETPTDQQLSALARRAAEPAAVVRSTDEHFLTWIRGRTPEQIEQQRIARAQANRDLTRRPGWTLDLAIVIAGEPVGLQSLSGFDRWPQRRIVGTTSWLLAPFQGRGLGTRSRAASLELAFTYLRAEAVKSWVLDDNLASIGVSTKLGYRLVDQHDIIEHGCRYTEHVYQLDRETWRELIAEYLRRFDPDVLPEVFDRTDLTPRERLLAALDLHGPLCPFIAAAVEIQDPGHPARVHATDYKRAFAARLTDTAREAGAAEPERLGEQLALLLDGASARNRVLNAENFATAADIAVVLIDNAIPTVRGGTGQRRRQSANRDRPRAGSGGEPSRSRRRK